MLAARLGYGAAWYSESHLTREPLTHGAVLLCSTEKITVAREALLAVYRGLAGGNESREG